jgi:hypothetical protein
MKFAGMNMSFQVRLNQTAIGRQNEQICCLEANSNGVIHDLNVSEVIDATIYGVLTLEDQDAPRFQDAVEFTQRLSVHRPQIVVL